MEEKMPRRERIFLAVWALMCAGIAWYVTPPWNAVRIVWDVIPTEYAAMLGIAAFVSAAVALLPLTVIATAFGAVRTNRGVVALVIMTVATGVYTMHSSAAHGWSKPAIYTVNKTEAMFWENVLTRGVRPTEMTGTITRNLDFCFGLTAKGWEAVDDPRERRPIHLCARIHLAPADSLSTMLAPLITHKGQRLDEGARPLIQKAMLPAIDTAEMACIKSSGRSGHHGMLDCMSRETFSAMRFTPHGGWVNQVTITSFEMRPPPRD